MDMKEFKGFDYEPQEAETETLLSDLPLSLIMSSIQSQFDDPLSYKKNDFVQSFITKYIITKENMTEDDEEEVQLLYTKFVSFMRDLFYEKLSIGLPELEDSTEEDQMELIHYIYRFFIVNIKKNFSNFILNYIKDNKEALIETLPKKKDVTTLSLKSIVDEDDLIILASLDECIKMILQEDISVGDFLNLSRSKESDLENDFIDDKYDEFIITGNFVPLYFRMVDDDFKVELECKIRNRILKKYRKK